MSFDVGCSESLVKIYDAAYSPSAWVDAMEMCRRMTSAKHAMFFSRSRHEDVVFGIDGGSPTLVPYADVLAEYTRRFAGSTGYDDEGEAYLNRSVVGAPVFDTDIWPLDYLEARPEVQYLKDTMGSFRKMYLNISPDPLMSAVTLFFYDATHKNISDRDAAVASLFGPHLMKALDISRWADRLRQKYQAVLSVLDRLELGICISNANGDIILHNRHAAETFANKDGLWLGVDGKLHSSNSEDRQRLFNAIHKVSATAMGQNRVNSVEILIDRQGTQSPLLVIASPLRDAGMELERNLTGCLLTIVDTERQLGLRSEAFCAAYGLTPMEQRAAELLMTGLTTPEIGEELGVATSTAQTHVKAVFQKTRSTNRVNFVWKAVQFSPPIT